MSTENGHLRELGRGGPSVSALGLGLMGLSKHYGLPPSDDERFALLDRAVEIGATFWDSSDWYDDNEELLGKWFKRTGKRDKIFLATKFGFVKGSMSYELDTSAAYAKKACEESLRILGTDYIDLYYAHRADPKTPIEETMRALAELKAQGKIKHIGLCEVSSDTLRRASKIARVDAVQMEYSPFDLDIEGPKGTNLLATCRELGIAVVVYSPLGRGLLTGSISSKHSISSDGDWRAGYPRFSGENLETNMTLVDQFKEVAKRKNCTPAQLALAWLLKQDEHIIPIPGTKKIKYLEENWAALQVRLTDAEEREIRDLVEGKVAGARAPGAGLAQYFADTVEEYK